MSFSYFGGLRVIKSKRDALVFLQVVPLLSCVALVTLLPASCSRPSVCVITVIIVHHPDTEEPQKQHFKQEYINVCLVARGLNCKCSLWKYSSVTFEVISWTPAKASKFVKGMVEEISLQSTGPQGHELVSASEVVLTGRSWLWTFNWGERYICDSPGYPQLTKASLCFLKIAFYPGFSPQDTEGVWSPSRPLNNDPLFFLRSVLSFL